MRFNRVVFILLAFYFVFLGGSAYYFLAFPVRILHHALVTALLAWWLFRRFRQGKGLPSTPLNKPIYAAVIVWFVSAMTSLDPRMAFENLWFPLTHLIFFFVLVDLFQRGRQRLVMDSQFMMAAMIIVITGLELASWYFGLGIIPGTEIGWASVLGPDIPLPLVPLRVSLAMNISTLLAGYAAPLITLTIGWALTAQQRNFRTVLWVMVGLLSVELLLTFSRGGLLSLVAGVGTLLVMRLLQSPRMAVYVFTRRIPTRYIVSFAILSGIVAVALFVFSLSQSRSTGDLGRLDMWQGAVNITGDNPFLGVGPGLYGRAFRSYRDPALARDKLASAHNAYLNTAAETGLIGVAVSLWLGAMLITAFWRRWKEAKTPARKIRLEATFAALVGVAIHSLVDVFTTTPIVLLIILLAAYTITGHRSRLDTLIPAGPRWASAVALIIVLGYGLWFVQLDRAQSHYQRSLTDSENAQNEARAAAAIDPAMNLYQLQIAYLSGVQVASNPEADLSAAIAAYEHALALEPTWDTGWINLAILQERSGLFEAAVRSMDKARNISELNNAALHWARLAEQIGGISAGAIIDGYLVSITEDSPNIDIPLSGFWDETELRRMARDQYTRLLDADLQYRVFAVHAPELAASLVLTDLQTTQDWWIAGQHTLVVGNDPEAADAFFTEAIRLDRTNGDYYASRARARLEHNPDAARRDLDLAQLLGTLFEYPNAIRAELADSAEEAQALHANALPARSIGQEFAAVLYGRVSGFDVFPEARRPGPGRAAMQPWYVIAEDYLRDGHIAEAITVYDAILDYAPYEIEAQLQREELQNSRG